MCLWRLIRPLRKLIIYFKRYQQLYLTQCTKSKQFAVMARTDSSIKDLREYQPFSECCLLLESPLCEPKDKKMDQRFTILVNCYLVIEIETEDHSNK